MALIFPFRGFRYNRDVVPDLHTVITQPYDKTTPSMQDAYHLRSPYNAVRITLNLEKREDPETDYAGAGAVFRQWLEQKILVQDPLPAVYAYYQEYAIEGQTRLQKGFISLLDLKDTRAGVLPHELTLAAPKQDRLRLLRSIEGNDDLIQMLYADDRLAVNGILENSVSGRQPDFEVRDEYDTLHRVWAITHPAALKEIQSCMAAQNLFIADGHHRFETAISFLKECEQRGWKPAEVESFDKRMVTCFNSVDGVTILATHRLIRDLPSFDPRAFLTATREHFHVDPVSSAEELWETMKEDRAVPVFGFYPASLKNFFLLRLKPEAIEDPLLMRYSEARRRLDVSILHTLLLERYLGISEDKLAAQAHIDYARDCGPSVQLADEGKYQAVFFLNPTTVEQMLQVASLGERMPQKSTDFFPKLLTGLVFMKMEIHKP
jgi:uncharacterized protein (DUF1015 family)